MLTLWPTHRLRAENGGSRETIEIIEGAIGDVDAAMAKEGREFQQMDAGIDAAGKRMVFGVDNLISDLNKKLQATVEDLAPPYAAAVHCLVAAVHHMLLLFSAWSPLFTICLLLFSVWLLLFTICCCCSVSGCCCSPALRFYCSLNFNQQLCSNIVLHACCSLIRVYCHSAAA